MQKDRGEYGKLYYQERVTVIWIEKLKTMGSGALYGVERGRGSAEERVILVDVSYAGMVKGVNQTASNPPIKVISSDVRTLRDGNRNRGRVVRVFRHTLGRRDSCQW